MTGTEWLVGAIALLVITIFIVGFVALRVMIGKLAKSNEAPEPEVDPALPAMPADPPAARDNKGRPDKYLKQCFFAIGLLGPPTPPMPGEKMVEPEPYLGLLFKVEYGDRPSHVGATIRIPSISENAIESDALSHMTATRIPEQDVIDVLLCIPLKFSEDLPSDIKEKLNLYGRIDANVTYTLNLNGNIESKSVDAVLRWRSPYQVDEDISSFLVR